jgi:hypothetical protein
MTTALLSPIVSEFETQAKADAYEQWFKAKVQASLNDPRPKISHADAIALLEKNLSQRRILRAQRHAAT